MINFNIKDFKTEYESGDIWGLEYIEKTIIEELKEKNNKNAIEYTKEDYIINLFYAVKQLNKVNDIYENSVFGASFNYNLYFDTKELLFKVLEIEV